MLYPAVEGPCERIEMADICKNTPDRKHCWHTDEKHYPGSKFCCWCPTVLMPLDLALALGVSFQDISTGDNGTGPEGTVLPFDRKMVKIAG